MNKYKFKASKLIAEDFEKFDIKFDVNVINGMEQVAASFPIDGGPAVTMRFISTDNCNDVAVRIIGLLRAPKGKRARIMEACNALNLKLRYLKFYVDADGDVNVSYDVPVCIADDNVGKVTLEILCRVLQILKSEYSIFMKAIYTDDALQPQKHSASAQQTAQAHPDDDDNG